MTEENIPGKWHNAPGLFSILFVFSGLFIFPDKLWAYINE
jgi:hypothetical protein